MLSHDPPEIHCQHRAVEPFPDCCLEQTKSSGTITVHSNNYQDLQQTSCVRIHTESFSLDIQMRGIIFKSVVIKSSM